jgi:predicted membrane protein
MTHTVLITGFFIPGFVIGVLLTLAFERWYRRKWKL